MRSVCMHYRKTVHNTKAPDALLLISHVVGQAFLALITPDCHMCTLLPKASKHLQDFGARAKCFVSHVGTGFCATVPHGSLSRMYHADVTCPWHSYISIIGCTRISRGTLLNTSHCSAATRINFSLRQTAH